MLLCNSRSTFMQLKCESMVRLSLAGVPRSASRDLFKRLVTIPFHGVAHRRLECVEFGGGTPTDVEMLGSRKSDLAVLWSSPVNHADVFMRVGDAMDVKEPRRDQGARARLCRRRAFADQFHLA